MCSDTQQVCTMWIEDDKLHSHLEWPIGRLLLIPTYILSYLQLEETEENHVADYSLQP